MLYPVVHIIEERLHRYRVGVDADIRYRPAKGAGPFLHFAEHPLVQRQREADVQQVSQLARPCAAGHAAPLVMFSCSVHSDRCCA